jgi:gluconolactonase
MADDTAEAFHKLVRADAKVQKLVGGMQFIEGPVWTDDDGGYLLFSDIPANKIMKWDGNTVSVFREDSHGTNGNTRDPQGRLVSCEHTARRVTRTEKDGTISVVVSSHGSARFNSPNDVVVMREGTTWFTDPPYGLPKGEKRELDKNFVFCFGEGHLVPAVDDFDMPNGLCLSPDEKKLYIADSGKPRHIRVFDVVSSALGLDPTMGKPAVPWKLTNGRVFCRIDKGAPDGIRCDEQGNIWSSAGDGVHVFSPDGKLIGKIPVPETPANLCFGGTDGKTLFVTARTSLYSIPTLVRGASRPNHP